MSNPIRLLNLMTIALKAIGGIKRAGEKEFEFFLELANLQPTAIAISAPTKPAVVVSAVVEQAPVPPTKLPAPKPGTILSPVPTPGKPLPADRPERKMRGEAPKPPVSGDFAAKLNGAAVALGKEDKSVLGRFRKVLADTVSKGLDYWNLCREVTEDALRGAELTEADWGLLVSKMKHNLFFTGKNGALFIERCPKEKLASLLLDQDGLTGLVARIRAEDYESKSSIYQLAFVMDAGKKVGSDAKVLIENCKYAVNRMKQRGFIPADHWLIGKVKDFNRPKLPEKKFASPEEVKELVSEVPAPAQSEPAELPAETIAAEPTDPDSMTMEELEARTAPEPSTGSNGDKPAKLDPAFETAFEQQMLNSAGEPIPVQ